MPSEQRDPELLHEALNDALDDLPRYFSITQPDNGWLPGDNHPGPTMRCCVYVDDVREMLRRVVLSGRVAEGDSQ